MMGHTEDVHRRDYAAWCFDEADIEAQAMKAALRGPVFRREPAVDQADVDNRPLVRI